MYKGQLRLYHPVESFLPFLSCCIIIEGSILMQFQSVKGALISYNKMTGSPPIQVSSLLENLSRKSDLQMTPSKSWGNFSAQIDNAWRAKSPASFEFQMIQINILFTTCLVQLAKRRWRNGMGIICIILMPLWRSSLTLEP